MIALIVGAGFCAAGWAAELTDHRLVAAVLFLVALMLFLGSILNQRESR